LNAEDKQIFSLCNNKLVYVFQINRALAEFNSLSQEIYLCSNISSLKPMA